MVRHHYFRGKHFNTVEFKIMVIIVAIMLPLIALLNFSSYYLQSTAREQVMNSFNNVLKTYMNQVENSLNEVNKYIYAMDLNSPYFQTMLMTKDENQYALNEIWLSNQLNKDISGFQYVDSIFVYNSKNDHYIYGSKDELPHAIRNEIFKYVKEARTKLLDRQAGIWYFQQIGKNKYVFRTIMYGKLIVGAWVSETNLLKYLQIQSIRNNRIELIQASADKNGTIIRTGKKYFVTDEISGTKGFGLAQYVTEKQILKQIPTVNGAIRVLSIVFVLLLPLTLLTIRKMVVKPLKDLRRAMRTIENGDISLRLKTEHLSYEFERVNKTFNNMMDQIEHLKIDVYEKKVREKRVQLRNLRLQMNPHFLLNTLNLLYSYEKEEYPHIQRMILYLVKYFRYMYKANEDFVSLEYELTHVENYMNIQKIRYPDSFLYEVNREETLKDFCIPPMLLQTFVENAIKHGMVLGGKTVFTINLEIGKTEDNRYLEIIIRDNGSGFSQEVLEKIRSRQRYADKNGEHIGIWNSLMRLDMLYNEEARTEFYNSAEGGAVVRLLLPLLTQTTGRAVLGG